MLKYLPKKGRNGLTQFPFNYYGLGFPHTVPFKKKRSQNGYKAILLLLQYNDNKNIECITKTIENVVNTAFYFYHRLALPLHNNLVNQITDSF